VYNAGGIPCSIEHGSINMRLKWKNNVVLSEQAFDPLLVTCMEGMIEENHPYHFIAYNASKELMQSEVLKSI
jgi:hypothetical protein